MHDVDRVFHLGGGVEDALGLDGGLRERCCGATDAAGNIRATSTIQVVRGGGADELVLEQAAC